MEIYACQPGGMGTTWSTDAKGTTNIQFGAPSGPSGNGPIQFRTQCGGQMNLTAIPLSYALASGHLRAEGSSLAYDFTLKSPYDTTVHVTGQGRVPVNDAGVACIDTSAGPVDIPLTGAVTQNCAPMVYEDNTRDYAAACDLSVQFDAKAVPQFKCAQTPPVQDSVPLNTVFSWQAQPTTWLDVLRALECG